MSYHCANVATILVFLDTDFSTYRFVAYLRLLLFNNVKNYIIINTNDIVRILLLSLHNLVHMDYSICTGVGHKAQYEKFVKGIYGKLKKMIITEVYVARVSCCSTSFVIFLYTSH